MNDPIPGPNHDPTQDRNATAAARTSKVHPKVTHRIAFLCFGLIAVGLGLLGVFLPLLPTTPFLIVAAWCFARSSQKLHDWLYDHPRFGRLLREWDAHRVIPIWAKVCAVTAMTASFLYMAFYRDMPSWLLAVTGVTLLAVAAYVVSKPNKPAAPVKTTVPVKPTVPESSAVSGNPVAPDRG